MMTLIAGLLGILFGFIVLVVLFCVVIYNKLVILRDATRSSWSEIDAHLKRRHDLVPTLVETGGRYAAGEKEVFEKTTEALSNALRASSLGEKADAERLLADAMNNFFTAAESYPELKANEKFSQLQTQFKTLEDKIERSKQYYNHVVHDFNALRESFPSKLIASSFKFEKAEFFGPQTPDVGK